MRPLFAVLGVQLALVVIFAVLVVSGVLPLTSDGKPGTTTARVNHFDGPAAWRLLKMQVAYGPRPAGSPASRKLAARLKGLLPNGRYQAVPGGCANWGAVSRGPIPRPSGGSARTNTPNKIPGSWARKTAPAASPESS